MVRYIDTGARDATEALGTWLGAELLGPSSVGELRVQSGFFSADALGYFEDALQDLHATDGHTRFLVGSNDGATPRQALSDLLTVVGSPRPRSRVGVVSFHAGYFHPKVVHVQRTDGTCTAYVGSANVTGAGVSSLNVEAGLVLDTATGDSQDTLDAIAAAIDAWFDPAHPSYAGLNEVAVDADLDPLVQDQIIGVAPPSWTARSGSSGSGNGQGSTRKPSLLPLKATPPLKHRTMPANAAPNISPSGQPPVTPAPVPQPAKPLAEHWGKKISASDADRKPGSKSTPRASIPLGQGLLRGQIDASQYFRHDMFGPLPWKQTITRTGEPYEETTVSIHVTVDGTYHGIMDFRVSHDPRRQQGKRNLPTTQLHTSPLAEVLKQLDITGMELTLDRDDNDEYWLDIH